MRPRDLRNHSQRPLGGLRALLERSGGGLGVSMDASRALQSSPGVLWVVFWEALGVSWVFFLTLFDQIYESEEVFEAKTATYSKMTYLTALLLYMF